MQWSNSIQLLLTQKLYTLSIIFQTATIDVRRKIYDLSINKYGSQIAIVENQGKFPLKN